MTTAKRGAKRKAAPPPSNGSVQTVLLGETGGWAQIETDPTWGELVEISGKAGGKDLALEMVAASLIRGWSKSEDATAEIIREMKAKEVMPLMAVVRQHVLPLFEGFAAT